MGPCVTLLVWDMGGHQSARVKRETQSRDGAAAAQDLGRGVWPQRPVAPQHRPLHLAQQVRHHGVTSGAYCWLYGSGPQGGPGRRDRPGDRGQEGAPLSI